MSERRSEPEAECGSVIVVGVQGEIKQRLIAQGHVHLGEDRKAIKNFDIGFGPGSSNIGLGPAHSHSEQIILQPTHIRWIVEQEVGK